MQKNCQFYLLAIIYLNKLLLVLRTYKLAQELLLTSTCELQLSLLFVCDQSLKIQLFALNSKFCNMIFFFI